MNAWKRFRHRAEYAGVKTVTLVAGVLPPNARGALGAVLGWITFHIVRIRRRVSVENVRRGLGIPGGDARAVRIASASYQKLGRSLVEFAGFDNMGPDDLASLVELHGSEHLDRALEGGRGAVVFTGHYGNWELMGAAVAAAGYPVNFLVGEQTNPRVNALMNDLRRRKGIGIISRSVALRKVLRALHDNTFVALLADQDARRGGVFVDFLGRPASTVRGPAMFAIRHDSPVIAAFITRRGARHTVELHPPLWRNPSLDGEAAVVDLTQRFTDLLTRAVRERPDEYFWAHRRWKTRPPSPQTGDAGLP